MAHGGNSHQRRKARRLESRRRASWRETAIRLWGYVPRSATEVALLEGGQWGKATCFDRFLPPAMKDTLSSPVYLLAEELRHGGAWTHYKMWHNRTNLEVPAGTLVLWDEMALSPTYTQAEMQRRIADLHIWGRPDMVLLDNGQVEMVDVKLSRGQEAHDE